MPEDWMAVPMSFGLIMAGFAGHGKDPITIYLFTSSLTW
jgi:hypothetical protein